MLKESKSTVWMYIITVLIVALGILSREIDIPNFNAIPAVAIILGAFSRNKTSSFLLLIVAMAVSDIFYGFHLSAWAVYISFAIMFALGSKNDSLTQKLSSTIKSRSLRLGISAGILSTLSAVFFFLITNAAVWMEGFIPGSNSILYSNDISGLIDSYVAGLLFIREYGYPILTSTLLFTVPTFFFSGYLSERESETSTISSAKNI